MGEAARKLPEGTGVIRLSRERAKRAAAQRVYERPVAHTRTEPQKAAWPAVLWSSMALVIIGLLVFLALQVTNLTDTSPQAGVSATDAADSSVIERAPSQPPMTTPIPSDHVAITPPVIRPFYQPLSAPYAPYASGIEWQRAHGAAVMSEIAALTEKVGAVERLIEGSPFNEAIRHRLAELNQMEDRVEAANARVAAMESEQGAVAQARAQDVARLAGEVKDLRRKLNAALEENKKLKARPTLPGWRIAGVSPNAVAFETPGGKVHLVRAGESITDGVKLLSIDLKQKLVRTSAGDIPASAQ